MDKKYSYVYVQKSWTIEYKLTLEEDCLKYCAKDLEYEFETLVHYVLIQDKKRIRYQTINTMDGYLYAALFIVVIVSASLLIAGRGNTITSIFGMLTLSLAIAGFWIFRVKEIGIPFLNENGINYIILFEDKPSKGFGQILVDKIYEARRKCLRENYLQIINDNTKEEELERMEWLYKEEAISKSEYHLMIELIEDAYKNK